MKTIVLSSVYRRTADGCQSMRFAANLLRSLHGTTLSICVPSDGSYSASLLTNGDTRSLVQAQNKGILEDVVEVTGLTPDQIQLVPDAVLGIVIDHPFAVEAEDFDVLYPARETDLLARGPGSVLVPFGDSISALTAGHSAFALARELALPVVLYHTTWHDPAVKSDNAEDHMCREAKTLWARLKAMAEGAGVQFKTVVECADDVVEGILRCGMRESSRLLVMSRSDKTIVGCYVDQALKQSPIPVLAVAPTVKGGNE